MRITGVNTRIIQLSAEAWFEPRPIPEGHVPFWEFPFTTIRTDAGIDGYTSDYGPLGQGRGSAYLAHDVYYHDLVGQNPLHHEAIWQRLRLKQRHLYNMTAAIWSNLDVALWDIKGKAAGLPVATLLGQYRDRVPTYATCPPQTIETVDEVERQIRAKLALGFAGVKLQLTAGPERDLPRLRKAREVAGPGFPLMVDCAGVYSFEEALKVGFALDELGYEWFEEPLPDAHIDRLKSLSDAIRTPVLAAETVGLLEMPAYVLHRAVDMVRADVHHKGGITGLLKAIGFCELTGYGLEIHTASSPLLDVANLHVACATRLSKYLEAHHPMFRFGLKGNPLEIAPDGCQHLPEGPGLGVEPDWDWIDRHTVEVIEGCRW